MSEKVPKIRFKGFEEEWKEDELGKIGDTYTGLSGKTKEDFGHGKGRYITYMNIFANPVSSLEQLDKIEIDKNQNEVIKGDVFFTTSSETPDEVGMSSVWTFNQKNVYLNSFCFGYRPKIEIDSYYLAFLLRSPRIRKEITFLAQGISRYNISKTKVMEINIPIASDKEQIKIGKLFKIIDDLINHHQNKYDKLVNIKKSMLGKMFPKEGKDTPEIRFKGFIEPWKPYKLEELSETLEYGLNAAAKKFDGKNKYLRITDIDEQTRKFLYGNLTSPDININDADKFKLKNGDIVFARTGASVGKTYIYDAADNEVYYAGFLIRARIKSEYSAEFIFQNTLTDRYKRYVHITSQRSGQPGVNAQEYSEFTLMVPTYEEQIKIGEYFKSLDKLMNLRQQELEKLKNIKKSLLEKIFV